MTPLARAHSTSIPVEVDATLAERLQLAATELGARGLTLAVIVRALLVEAATQLEAERDARRLFMNE